MSETMTPGEMVEALPPARRLSRTTDRGSVVSVSAPAGVPDEVVWAEVDRVEERIRRGYFIRGLGFEGISVNVRWLSQQPRFVWRAVVLLQRLSRSVNVVRSAYAWVKFRALDAYWFARDRLRTLTGATDER